MSTYWHFAILLCCALFVSNVWTMSVNSTPLQNSKGKISLDNHDSRSTNLSKFLNFVNFSKFANSGHHQSRKVGVEVPPVTPEGRRSGADGNYSTATMAATQLLSPTATSCANCLKKVNYLKEIVNTNQIPSNGESDYEIDEVRIEDIKKQILKKLRMDDRPNVTMQRSMVPEPLQGGELHYLFKEYPEQPDKEDNDDDDDDYYGKTERVIILAEYVDFPSCQNHPHHDPAGCFHFKLTTDINKRDVSYAQLWVYKLRDKRDSHNQTYSVSEIPTSNHTSTTTQNNIVSIRDTSLKNGWIKFDLTATIRRWLLKPRTNIRGLKISCKTCRMNVEEIPVSNDPGEKPFIVVNFNTNSQRRSKRNAVCEPKSPECCKYPLYVNFTDIGWNDWVLAPEGYWANFCKGSCYDDMTSNSSHYSSILQLVRSKTLLSPSQKKDLSPCCSPKKLKPITMLYSIAGGNIMNDVLPTMIVESCGCK